MYPLLEPPTLNILVLDAEFLLSTVTRPPAAILNAVTPVVLTLMPLAVPVPAASVPISKKLEACLKKDLS